MILSVIIVNYNVKYFLEQCLYSVEKALRDLADGTVTEDLAGVSGSGKIADRKAEILVVDNHSSDDSISYLRDRFPRVQFIVNEENLGFARANNQALRVAGGKYILFLNPDTILAEDSCRICLSFMEAMPGAGAAGLRMIDGSGHFLKESRRGFPSPWVAFCKLAGLTALFPHSRFLAEYYLGYLPAAENHPAPVLSGACMWVRKEALDKAGSFDEQFFMYAEDIDLSYRIGQAGYVNYYIADTTILHFKGESTRKDARYIKLFYKAMSQFRRKHSGGGVSALFTILLEMAIWLRAGITAIVNALRGAVRPDRAGGSSGVAVVKTAVTGDPAGVARLTADLSACPDREWTPDLQEAEEIIFCEGAGFSFKDCIEALQSPRRRVFYKIHASGSGSAVGSHSKEERGQTILLERKETPK